MRQAVCDIVGDEKPIMMRIDAEQYGGLCTCGEEHRMATRLCVIGADVLADTTAELKAVILG